MLVFIFYFIQLKFITSRYLNLSEGFFSYFVSAKLRPLIPKDSPLGQRDINIFPPGASFLSRILGGKTTVEVDISIKV